MVRLSRITAGNGYGCSAIGSNCRKLRWFSYLKKLQEVVMVVQLSKVECQGTACHEEP